MNVLPDELVERMRRFLEEKKSGNAQINIKRGKIDWANITEHVPGLADEPKAVDKAQRG